MNRRVNLPVEMTTKSIFSEMCFKRIMRVFHVWIAFSFSLCLPGPAGAQSITDEAQRIYEVSHPSVVQIQVIDLATGKKTSIGSGFQFTAQGHIATNFHVVSEAVHAPQRFRIESLRHDGAVGLVDLLDIDVVHDLAIVLSRDSGGSALSLGHSQLSKGTRLFAMGNPFDLGMTVMEGIYNGLMEDSFYRKILFSGSLNPGMSGGPAFNREGEVIGVNVSTAGNEVSFLVPVEYLKGLYDNLIQSSGPAPRWEERIKLQLIANQEDHMKKLLDVKWETLEVGDARVPGELLNVFKCWGKSEDKESELYNYAYINCATSDEIFLSSSLSTGQVLFQYYWMTSKGLNPIRFYHLYENHFRYPHPYENAEEDDVTNFRCDNNFVDVNGRDMKVLWCARNYKRYPALYDINLSMALVDRQDRGLLVEVVALGLGKQNAIDFIRKFMKEIQWRNSPLK